MPFSFKESIVKSKIRQARLAAIKRVIRYIPVKPTFDENETNYEVGYARGRAAVAAEIRAILDSPDFKGAYVPCNTGVGK
jgi:hypothetical protein